MITIHSIKLLILLSLATSAVSVTISHAKIFTWLRKLPESKFLQDLLHCAYCLSHWFAAVGIVIYGRGIMPLASWPLYWLAAVALAAIWSTLILSD